MKEPSGRASKNLSPLLILNPMEFGGKVATFNPASKFSLNISSYKQGKLKQVKVNHSEEKHPNTTNFNTMFLAACLK